LHCTVATGEAIVTPQSFADLSDLVRRRSGLVLTGEKKPLIKNRLLPVAKRFGFRDTTALLAELPYPSEELAHAITEAMTTNETSFFRDSHAFEFIAHSALPALVRARAASQRLRIWCAAVSTGQEAYSLAAVLDDTGLSRLGWKIDLIATDFNESAIARARTGLYTPYEVERGLPAHLLRRHFAKEGGYWRVADRLRRMVTFRTFNLLDHYGWLGEIDIIFCRNVLLYFEPGARSDTHAKLAATLASDGYLLLGENEHAPEEFVAAARGIYVKTPRIFRLAMFG
jgi:chemotaxis protein methyltransferase CheR